MTARLNPMTAAPTLMKTWHGASVAIASSIEHGLRELVEVRASQINGCANCVNMHTVFACENGETEQRLYRVARARAHVREARPRFQVEKRRGLEIAEAFFAASRSGDMKTLGAMLAADVSVHADGGGKRPAAPAPIFGFDAVMRFNEAVAGIFQKNPSKLVRSGFVNGLPGFVTLEADGELATTALEIEDGKITAIYVVRNPDKLKHLH